MPSSNKLSAGLLMYRERKGVKEVFLVHPGGPFYKNKDNGAWSIPKGEVEEDESNLLEVAKREFREETSFVPDGEFVTLGSVINDKSKKVIHAWAFEKEVDPSQMKSNTTIIDWPPKTGKKLEIPECDRGEYFDLATAKQKIVSYQVPIIEAFEKLIK